MSLMSIKSNQHNSVQPTIDEFLTSEFGQNCVGIQEKSARIHWKFNIFGIAHHFLEYSAKFREILIKIGAKFDEKR